MALTRKFLKAMELEDGQIDSIIEAHTDTVNALKAQIAEYKESADKLPELQKQLDEAQAGLAAEKKESWQDKYKALQTEFDNYKSEQESKGLHEAKENAYKGLLKDAGISDKRIDAVLKVSDIDGVELDDKGEVKSAAEILDQIKKEWAEFIPTTAAEGAKTATPPNNTGGNNMTKEEIFKIKDPVQRQNAIAENITLFTGKDE